MPIDERLIRGYFVGEMSPSKPEAEVLGTIERLDDINTNTRVRSMEDEFVGTRTVAVRLCGDVLDGKMRSEILEHLGFILSPVTLYPFQLRFYLLGNGMIHSRTLRRGHHVRWCRCQHTERLVSTAFK